LLAGETAAAGELGAAKVRAGLGRLGDSRGARAVAELGTAEVGVLKFGFLE